MLGVGIADGMGNATWVGRGPAITDPDAGIAIITDIIGPITDTIGRHIEPIRITEAIHITGRPTGTVKTTSNWLDLAAAALPPPLCHLGPLRSHPFVDAETVRMVKGDLR